MKKLLIFVLVLAVAVGALGYWRGWFNVSREGVQVDAEKFKKDREDFSKTVSEKAKVVKNKFANLWKKTEGLTGGEKAQAEKELAELEEKHERLVSQFKELEDAGQDRFETLKQDLSKTLEEVEGKMQDLTKKLEKGKSNHSD